MRIAQTLGIALHSTLYEELKRSMAEQMNLDFAKCREHFADTGQ